MNISKESGCLVNDKACEFPADRTSESVLLGRCECVHTLDSAYVSGGIFCEMIAAVNIFGNGESLHL